MTLKCECGNIYTDLKNKYGSEKIVEILFISLASALITAIIAANLIPNEPNKIIEKENN